jgi:hypothetical protein
MAKNDTRKQSDTSKQSSPPKGKADEKKNSTAPKQKSSGQSSADKPASKADKAKLPVAKSNKKAVQTKKTDATSPAPKEKSKKAKLVRDSFTMPEEEYKLLGDVKRDCLKAGIEVKKSQLLRVGVALIRQMEINKLKTELSGLPALKAGRPKKEK